ncbi:MAG: peptide chain release factor N(5)-glutamine methyltransferase [Hydrogenophaga sp.]|uniref:peptide chain release factor N(5)-glutamine methyltransferase n=1 Tax=Hydrogenophaga sp. TaxID=1904254 RepID=UPI0025BBF719|nr:peptide chain release factor N(5)-glutamine methyltransferase [Hydrogenophaga sp.]MDO9504691.1 peptide chain release factor N(5)-glutamine methyltransferase [Hydrogenophaga sp.]MDP3205425.1 peptide chain release factor N(5)-glutamine methyltransferase [Hydrogenophaga sp.]MDP3627521.1 peptide chain release factor N(5)-glutamine methyltransferase [Hydrogenophaga sp.]
MNTVRQTLAVLQQGGLDRLDAQMLLLLALQRSPHDRAWLVAHDGDALPADAAARLAVLVGRRQRDEPMAYLRGDQEFFGLQLQVDRRVLVPRPDTETLVNWALEKVDDANDAMRVLDLGTGSGAIALAIASQRPTASVSATDASDDALAVARSNAQRLGLPVRFHAGSWLDAVPGQRFEVIVTNPPYIAEHDPHLAALTHEPLSALTAGADGLSDIRTIVADAPHALVSGGWLLIEHGFDQAEVVRGLLQAAGFEQVSSRTDLAAIERCSGGQWPQRR